MKQSLIRRGKSIQNLIGELMQGRLINTVIMSTAEKNRVYRSTKKQDIWESYVALCEALNGLEKIVDMYVVNEVDLRSAEAVKNADKYEKMYVAEHKRVLKLKEDLQRVKNERRKEGTGRPAKYTDTDARLLHADRASGLSLRAIAAKRGMSVNTVRKLLNQNIINDTIVNGSDDSKNSMEQTEISDYIEGNGEYKK